MPKWDRNGARHLLMRAGLAFVMGWFGIQELRNPSEWAVFVPSFVSDHAPVAVNDLILLHGFLLLVAAAAVVLGVVYVLGCLLAMGLIVDIILGLWLDGGISDLVIRDLGLLALAGAMALDPVRFWHLEDALPRLTPPRERTRHPVKGGKAPLPPARPPRPPWPARAGAAAGLVVVVLGVGLLLHATGSTDAALPGDAVASLQSTSAPRSPSPASPAPGSSATPAPSGKAASSVRFADWKYKQYSFQIYPGEVGSDAKKALAGFGLSVQDQGDGTVLLVLKALSSRYHDATFTVDKANTAYFVETSMRDDPNDAENNLNDDGVVVVDPQGFMHLGS